MISTDSRKRKQQDLCDKNGLTLPNTSSWSEFIYSSPSSPSINHNSIHTMMDSTHALNLDTFFENQLNTNPQSGSNSRRHSVAVGELDYHSFDFLKQDMNILPTTSWDAHLQNLYNNDLPTAEKQQQKRSMSLRMDDLHNPLSYSHAVPDSLFFQPNCLDELMRENHNEAISADASMIAGSNLTAETSGTPYSDSNELLSRQDDLLKLASEEFGLTNSDGMLASSAVTNQINNIADWLLQNTQEQAHKRQKVRHGSNESTLPVSPEQISGSSLCSLSPSPPITPTQQVSVGFESHSYLQNQVPHNGTEKWDFNGVANNNNKANAVACRILQGQTTASSLKPLIQDYLIRRDHQDRTLPVTGERTVMVLTSKVAQKSYGTEKRFLCPPPTTVLKGSNWCTDSLDKSDLTEQKKTNNYYHSTNAMSTPKLTIHISGESITQQGTLEWQSSSGTIVDNASLITASNSSSPVSGKCVSKQLYINDADEKRKRVEVLAKIQLGNGLQFGTFPSKGIKVISKPSKKRQSIKNMELCIHHGTTISLFNRIRSQTVSTKYLGVSSGTQSAPNKANGTNTTCFVARTGSWDPFVIWLVDTTRSPDATSIPRPNQHHPSNPDFPLPPAIAIQTPSSTQHPVAVHYNQPVVLQCVNTGLVSPVMVIRKVDKASMVLGGNKTDDLTEKTGGESGDETLGDPVSQLHKVAFQIVQNPMLYHQNKNKLGTDSRSSKWKLPQSCHPVTYLACLNDIVGMHKATSTRHFVSTCESAAAKATNGQQNTWSELLQKTTNSNGALADSVGENGDDKKTSNACKLNGTTTKSNGRVGAISNESKANGRRNSLLDGGRRGSTAGNDLSGLDGACWTEDVSDAAVWTIVGTDCASYTFWTPSEAPDQSYFNKLFTQQATTTLSNTSAPITPFPLISSQASPSAKLATTDSSVTSLTLSGENLTRDLMVWFGDIISPRTDYKSRDSITCTIPGTQELMSSPTVQLEDDGLKRKIPLILVRGDGVVYRTNQFYVF